jgi:hypothetical protein
MVIGGQSTLERRPLGERQLDENQDYEEHFVYVHLTLPASHSDAENILAAIS